MPKYEFCIPTDGNIVPAGAEYFHEVATAFALRPVPSRAMAASHPSQSAESWAVPEASRQQKITFGEMRASGAHGLLICCSDYKCIRSTASGADQWGRRPAVGSLSATPAVRGRRRSAEF
jgi:hypothetical protein